MSRKTVCLILFVACVSGTVLLYKGEGVGQQTSGASQDAVQEAQVPREAPSKRPEQEKNSHDQSDIFSGTLVAFMRVLTTTSRESQEESSKTNIGGNMMDTSAQIVPVRISQSEKHLLLVAPMPGIKPADISVTIAGRSVKITGQQTGSSQDEKDLIVAEWTIGPYFRELELPQAVNGRLTNATFGNGILTLAMPKTDLDQSDATFKLAPIDGSARGEYTGHKGIDIKPTQ